LPVLPSEKINLLLSSRVKAMMFVQQNLMSFPSALRVLYVQHPKSISVNAAKLDTRRLKGFIVDIDNFRNTLAQQCPKDSLTKTCKDSCR
jgi:hypothetical protein